MIEKIKEHLKKIKNNIVFKECNNNISLNKKSPYLKIKYKPKNDIFVKKIDEYIDILLNTNNEQQNEFILKNLESLKIKNNNFIKNAFYLPHKNTIYLGKDKEESLSHELLHVASTYVNDDITYTGFCQMSKNEEIGRGINEGFTELFNKQIFKDYDALSAYSLFEVDVAKELIKLLDYETVKTYYFNADLISLCRLLKKYDSSENIIKFIKKVDYVTNNINKLDTSQTMREIYIDLYKWNAIRLKEKCDNNEITKKEYENELLNNNKIYPARMMISLGITDPIPNEVKREVRRIII